MAQKRRIEVRLEPEPTPEPPGRTWGEWLRQDYARYWFGLLALLINCFLSLQMAYWLEDMAPLYAIVIPTFIALMIPEVLIYKHIWGQVEES